MRVAVYVRVSTSEQDSGLASQKQAIEQYLKGHGITDATWYEDRISGAKDRRPGLDRLQKDIFSGKVKCVIVWKLDRLSRSLRHGINLLSDWLQKDVRVVAISQQLDFSGAAGNLIASVLFAVAAMERETLRENTRRGLATAKANGKVLGRPRSSWQAQVKPLFDSGLSGAAIAKELGASKSAVYSFIKREGITKKQKCVIHIGC